ncbi:MAG: 50S ribosomal protein L11 methyltransferase [Chloroflexi bacterium]|nr:50S ribosomal protein L11 methyltransferase [Chloroflexota bacterium]
MDWIEISIRADGEAAEAVSELFNRLNSRGDGEGGAVVEVGGFDPIGDDHHPFVTVRTYLPADLSDIAGRQQQIEEGLWFLGRIYPLGEPQIRRLAEEDWANTWKANYKPLHIGRRFLVVPAWLTPSAIPPAAAGGTEGGLLPIILDPGMAFGTGLHPSTQLVLRAMEDVVGSGQRALDAGCGSGILSIAAVRLGAASVDAFDIDPIAVRATEENAALNDLPLPINVSAGAGPDDGPFWHLPGGARRTWDVILVNILPHIIIGLLQSGLHTYLAPGGCMILAGIIEEREPEVVAALAERGLAVAKRLVEGDWVALVAA